MSPVIIAHEPKLKDQVRLRLPAVLHELAAIRHKQAILLREGNTGGVDWRELAKSHEEERGKFGKFLRTYATSEDPEWQEGNREAIQKLMDLYNSLINSEVSEDYDFYDEDTELFEWFGIE